MQSKRYFGRKNRGNACKEDLSCHRREMKGTLSRRPVTTSQITFICNRLCIVHAAQPQTHAYYMNGIIQSSNGICNRPEVVGLTRRCLLPLVVQG